ncbi:porin [Brenneria populi]|uniref:Porin n=1 Tax=Brenneria populi TaxID=1505588 RepID=A0ABU6JMG5_9GAMM|nr:porin [Brenneria populi Li et al. 2015]
MMKRNILAVVIPALLAAGAVNAAEIYNKDGNKLDLNGRVDARHLFSEDDSNNGDTTRARIGFKGETQITSDLTGYGRYETEVRTDSDSSEGSGSSFRTRFAFAGLKFADFGSLDYGRNQAIGYDGIAYTDVLPVWGGDHSYTDGITGRKDGVLTYRNKDFFGLVDGLNFGLQAISKDSDDTLSSSRLRGQNGDGWGTSLSYESDIGLGVVASYAAVKRLQTQNAGADLGDKADTWAAGVKYDANNLYLAATYGEYTNTGNVFASGVNLDKTQIFEAVAQYTFDFGLTPSLAYVQGKGKEQTTGTARRDDDVNKYVSVAATYAFNKNFSTYVDYKINLLDSDNAYVRAGDVSDEDAVGVGVKYQF